MGFKEFNDYFQSIYQDRWSDLLSSLKQPAGTVARPNGFCVEHKSFKLGGEIPRGTDGLLEYYVMDQASIWAARALEVQPGDRVLDMCAAPGGKTLVLAEALAEQGELIANEMSASRRERLIQVIKQYIPRHIRDRVFVNGRDGGLYARSHLEYFDRILIDAPCSGERHLLENDRELKEWTLSRTKKLAQRQYALLTAALLALKPGGTMVYSTCSISPLENDSVIDQLMKKKTGFEVDSMSLDGDFSKAAERTKHGVIILPDRSEHGPIYICRLRKL